MRPFRTVKNRIDESSQKDKNKNTGIGDDSQYAYTHAYIFDEANEKCDENQIVVV